MMARRYATLDELDRLGAEVLAEPTDRERHAKARRRKQDPPRWDRSAPRTFTAKREAPRPCCQPLCDGWPTKPAEPGQLSCRSCTNRIEANGERIRRGAERERR